MTEIFQAENLVALLILVLLEIVLGIDNVIFIAILSGKSTFEIHEKLEAAGHDRKTQATVTFASVIT